LVLQPASRRAARHTSSTALKRFFAIADAWELSPLQQCRLLKIPSPQVLSATASARRRACPHPSRSGRR
jgi:hypothetical protein